MELYSINNKYYLIDGEDIISLPGSAGEFLNKPEKLDIDRETNTQNILNNWGLEVLNLEDLNKNENLDYDTAENENLDYDIDEFSLFTEEEVKSVSEEQRLDIMNSDEKILFSTTQIPDITKYINKLSIELNNLPLLGNHFV